MSVGAMGYTSSRSLSAGFDVSFRESWTARLKAGDSATILYADLYRREQMCDWNRKLTKLPVVWKRC